MSFPPLAKTFVFESFDSDSETGRVVYHFTTDAGHVFDHEITVPGVPGVNLSDLGAAIFALGMVELMSYWKAVLAPVIIIRAGALNGDQVAFWENLYRKGLGEFFYMNSIDFRDLVRIVPDPGAVAHVPRSSQGKGILVPFGGGKDSLVTAELLKAQHKTFSWFELEPLTFGGRLREHSGVTDVVSVARHKEKNFKPIIDLVKQGAPNGHVPITASYLMSAVLAAEIYGYHDVVLSLERSAEFGNVEYLGMVINHQYSKSLEFETAAAAYVSAYINPTVRTFSLVRPLYELQIVEKFTHYPQYFDTFVSCNRGLKTGTWCGECAKCAFMYAALSAFLPPHDVEQIFKKNLFADAALIPLFTDLVGRGTMKPFDCVGTFEENELALHLAKEQYQRAGLALPVILTQVPSERGEDLRTILSERGPHRIPVDYTYE